MTHHVGFLYLSDAFGYPSELINEARTLANMQEYGAANPFLTEVLPNPCAGLEYNPCSVDADGVVTDWPLADLALEAAPWYGTSAASHEALGFTIDEWTGLDGGNHGRTTNPFGSSFGGSRFGPNTDRSRVMSINVTLHGLSERGLAHLFRWLETTLIDECSPDHPTSMWLREFCPAGDTHGLLEEGLLRLDDVVLLEGPTWVEAPITEASAYIRRANFVLGSGRPCLYRVSPPAVTTVATLPSPIPTDTVLRPMGCSEMASSAARVLVAVTAADGGLTSPLITINTPLQATSGDRSVMPPTRIYGVVDRAGYGSGRICELPRVGGILLFGVPGGFEIVIDGATGTIQARDLHGDREWVDGSQFTRMIADYDPSFVGTRGITFASCADGYVIVEPALVATNSLLGSGDTLLTTWTVEITAVTRQGCS